MIQKSRVLIIKDGRILFIRRLKNGKEYYVLPGGAIEDGETSEQAAIREAKEETNLDIELGQLLWDISEDIDGEARRVYVFSVNNFSGEIKMIGPELERQNGDNQYLHQWLSAAEIGSVLIYPEPLKEKIMQLYGDGNDKIQNA